MDELDYDNDNYVMPVTSNKDDWIDLNDEL